MTETWKITTTEYYTLALKYPNRHGAMQSACSRKVTSWYARTQNGEITDPCATKKEAMWLAAQMNARAQAAAKSA